VRAALVAAGLAVVAAGAALAAFGASATGMVAALARQQGVLATHSFPGVLATALGDSAVSPAARLVLGAGLASALVITLWRTWRGGDAVTGAGWVTVALLVTTTWLLPWYLVWALPFAAISDDRRLQWAVLGLTAYLVVTRVPPLG
jgi:hypothetical protein